MAWFAFGAVDYEIFAQEQGKKSILETLNKVINSVRVSLGGFAKWLLLKQQKNMASIKFNPTSVDESNENNANIEKINMYMYNSVFHPNIEAIALAQMLRG